MSQYHNYGKGKIIPVLNQEPSHEGIFWQKKPSVCVPELFRSWGVNVAP